MLKFYLNNQEIEEPRNWQGMSFGKQRHPKYFGYWGGVAGNDGGNSYTLEFEPDQGGDFVREAFERFGVLANLYLKVVDEDCESCNSFEYKADFRFFAIKECCICSVLFQQAEGLDLLTKVDVPYLIEPQTWCELPNIPIAIKTSHALNDTVSYAKDDGTAIAHNVPFIYQSGGVGIGYSVTDFVGNRPLLKSNYQIGKVLDISGVLRWVANASTPTTYTLKLEQISPLNVLDSSKIIGTYTTGTSSQQQSIFYAGYVLKPEHTLHLVVASTDNPQSFSFSYLEKNVIDVLETGTFINGISRIRGLTIKQAFEEVVRLAGGGKYGLCSNYLAEFGDSLWITNEQCLQGTPSAIKLSLDILYEGLNPIENLEMGFSGNCLYLERKGSKQRNRAIELKEVQDVVFEVGQENIYSHVEVGYSEWQTNDSPFRYDEVCSKRNYTTQVSTTNNKLDLISKFVASPYIIETIKSTKKTNYGNRKEDGDVFIVATVADGSKLRAELGADFLSVDGVLYPDKKMNLRISPVNNLRRWFNILKHSGNLTFTAGDGNYNAMHQGMNDVLVVEDANQRTDNTIPIFNALKAHFYLRADVSTFCELKDRIEFEYCGVKYSGTPEKVEFVAKEGGNEIEIETYLYA